jgi:uncharacterized protein (DUF433 family)
MQMGMIGLGRMGANMVRRLTRGGHTCVVYDAQANAVSALSGENVERAADVVVSDPEIRGGEPVIRGTRVPVYLIADLMSQGADAREILEDYPSLTANTVRSALACAQTHPRRGRPRKAPWHV